MEIFDNLNDRQKEAVSHIKGPLLVIAGAGSGKTLVLTRRIANLISNGVRPFNILAVTFTNKAANEMQTRIKNLLDLELTSRPLVGTFHSIGVRILRQEIENLNRKKDFTIFDADDSFGLIRQICKDFNIPKERYHPKAIMNQISSAKNNLLSVEEFGSFAYGNHLKEKALEVYKEFEKRLIKMNACDFDDLLVLPVKIFQLFPDVLEKYQERWKFLLVDEFQDTNFVQNLFVKMLSEKYQNICAIGDSDQSIYSFRGAKPENIINFDKQYKDVKIVKLEQNYRSTQNILDAANAVIDNNISRVPKYMFTNSGAGEVLKTLNSSSEQEEALLVLQEILNLKNSENMQYSDFVILYRTNAQSRVIEESALRFGVPYQIIGGIKFYARKEIKDLISYLRFIQNPSDSVSFLRIINIPPRKIGNVSILRLQSFAESKNLELPSVINHIEMAEGITPNTKKSIADFANKIEYLRGIALKITVSEFIQKVIEKIGLEKYYRDNTEEGEMRWENARELMSVAQKFDGIDNGLELFLEEVALITDADSYEEEKQRITLMTLHNAKGLEFPVVFIVGCEENLLPHSRSIFSPDELEEERRLFYVGMTRAQKKLYLSSASSRMLFGDFANNQQSRFISEIPKELIDEDSENEDFDEPTFTPIYDDYSDFVLEYELGDSVLHPKFGKGVVEKIEGDILTVNFENGEYKRFASSIAPLRKI